MSASSGDVHLLVNRAGPVFTTGCGITIEIRGYRMPDDLTAWGSGVTCESCNQRRKQ